MTVTLPAPGQSPINVSGVPEWGDASAMFGTAQTLLTATENYISLIQDTSQNIFAPVINPSFPSISTAPQPIAATMPALTSVSWNTPAQPAPFSTTLNIGNIMPVPFSGVAPTLTFGTMPTPFTTPAPVSPSISTAFTFPTVTAPVLPSVPTLLSIDQVSFNPLVIPTFGANVPTLSLSPPNSFSYVEKAFYTSSELTMVQASISNAILNGTDTGLDQVTQQSELDAAYEREYRAQANVLAELERMESLGYAFPPGAYLNGRIKAQTETANTMAGLSREIMVNNMKLRLENVKQARELAVSLEGKLIDYFNSVCQRAFEAAKYAVESGIAVYNAQVEMYKGQLDGYRTQAVVYQTQIDGIKAQVQMMQAQIDYEKTKAEINHELVSAYSEEINAALATLKVYEVETDIIKTQAEVQKLYIDIFSAQIQAYVGQVNAYTAQVEAYKTGIEAQGVVENVYKTQVDAYAAEVDAAVKVVDAQIAQYRAQIEAYTAQLHAYEASLQAMTEQARAASLYNTSQVEVFKGEVQANSAYNEALIQEWKAVVDTNERIAEVAVKAAEANGQLYISARGLMLDAAKAGAQVMAQLGAAALNAIHWSNSSTWSTSASNVFSTSGSTSTSSITEQIASV